MTRMTRTPIGRLQPGDEIFERKGRRFVRIGVVREITKNTKFRSVTVHLIDRGGFSQNWAAKVWVKA